MKIKAKTVSLFTAAALAAPSLFAGNIFLQTLADPPIPLTAVSANGHWKAQALPANSNRAASSQAILYKHEATGDAAQWIAPLTNPIMPQEIRVSNSGHVVTLDNWGEPGSGKEVVAIYGPDGLLRRQYALADLFTAQEIKSRVDRPLFDRPWREEAIDFFSADAATWTIRTAWGKVLRFHLETGSFTATAGDLYVLRRTPSGSALYRAPAAGGAAGLVPCLGIDLPVDALFCVRSSSKEAGGLGRLVVDGRGLTHVKTLAIESTQEREDVFRTTGAGSATIRLTNPRSGFDATIPVRIH